jgi:hypothetical protein
MKHIVGCRTAGETVLRRDNKSGNASHYEYWSENSQGYVVNTLPNGGVPPPAAYSPARR